MSSEDRRLRYGPPVAVVVIGVIVAAVNTASLGNTVATVLIAAGLIWFLVVLGRDLGMTERTGRRRRVPPPPEGEDRRDGHGE